MTAELVRGQNHPLSQARLEVRVSAGRPIVAGATLSDEQGRVRGVEWVAHPGAPTLPGLEVSKQAAADHRLAFDLDALPGTVHRVSVLLALPTGAGGPARFGAVAAPFLAVTGLDGSEVASYTITGLDTESAVVALELYRRQGAWKVRAVGQGYAGGLAELLTDQGLSEAQQLAGSINEAVAQGLARSVSAPPPRTVDTDRSRQAAASAPGPDQPYAGPQGAFGTVPPQSPYDAPGPQGATVPQSGYPGGPAQPDASAVTQPSAPTGGPVDYSHPGRQTAAPPPPPPAAPPAAPGQPAQPVAGDATGWSMEERLYNQVWGMFEDLARTTAAYRSAVDFADSRMEQELDKVLSDPRSRIGGQGDAAREAAQAKRAGLVDQAAATRDRRCRVPRCGGRRRGPVHGDQAQVGAQ
ncbi:TerD family protein, partial [Streptomyces sp. NPDC007095]|uniref:TerD family protein n=1 Tax=Streptomyces sp. NPDC007095 TaxID=3154482 RepID=UPI0033CB6D9E